MSFVENTPSIILASQSPRRCELLSLLGLPFTRFVTRIDEQRQPGETPLDYVLRLSREKARAAAQKCDQPGIVLAADTIVVDGDDVLEKPASEGEAWTMLTQLRSRSHVVYTAIAVLNQLGELDTEIAQSRVPMRDYSDEEIADYIASGDPFDKAGGYGIQNADFHPAGGFSHCFANVMGLPLCHLTRLLRQSGIEPPADVPAACQSHLVYSCPVYKGILRGED
ncbi:MAG: septum formation protein Maf [Anaerolineae bacterium]|nr:septum formation protein Maf [Anaerolineae bacterium]